MAALAGTPPPRRKRRRILRALWVLFALPLLLFGGLQTPPGKGLVVSLIARQVDARTPFSFDASPVRGFLPFTLSVDRVTVRDARGPWLEITGIAARLDARALVRGRLRLTESRADEVRLLRRPVKPRRLRVPVLPGVRWWPGADRIQAGRVVLEAPVFGQEAVYAAGGRLGWRGWGQIPDMELSAKRTDGPPSTVSLSLSHEDGVPGLHLSVSDEGLVPGWLETEGPFALDLRGGGTRADWKGTISATAGGDELLAGELLVRSGGETAIAGNLVLSTASVPRAAVLRRGFGDQQHLKLDLSVTQAGVWTLKGLSFAGGGLTASMQGQYDLASRSLGFSGEVHAPDGLPAAFADDVVLENTRGLTGAFTLDGTRDRPRARMALSQGERTLLAYEVGASLGEANGFAGVALLTPPEGWLKGRGEALLPAGPFQVRHCATVREGQWNVPLLTVRGPGQSFSFSGKVHPARRGLQGMVFLSDADNGTVSRLVQGLEVGRVAVGARLAMDGEHKACAGTVLAQAPHAAAAKAESLRADLTLSQQGGWDDWRGGVTWTAKGAASSAVASSQPIGALEWESNGTADPAGHLEVAAFRLSLPGHSSTVEGTAAVSKDGACTLDARAVLTDVATLPIPEGAALSGPVNAAFSATGDYRKQAFSGDLSVNSPGLSGLPARAQFLEAGKITAAAKWKADHTGITVSDGKGAFPGGTLAADGNYGFEEKRFAGRVQAAVDDLSRIFGEAGPPVQGKAELSAELAGTRDAFTAKGSVSGAGLEMGKGKLSRARAEFDLAGLPGKPGGPVRLEAELGDGLPPLSLRGRLAVDADRISLEKASLTNGPNSATGTLRYDRRNGALTGNVDASVPDIAPFGALAGAELRGGGTVTAKVSRRAARLQTEAEFSFSDLSTPWLEAESVSGSAAYDGGDSGAPVRGSVRARGLRRSGVRADTLEAGLRGAADGARVTCAAKGAVAGKGGEDIPLDMKTEGRLSLAEESLTLDTWTLDMGDVRLRASEPVALHRDAGGGSLRGVFSLGDGTASVSVSAVAAGPTAEIVWKGIPLEAARLAGIPATGGTATGRLALGGTWEATRVDLECALAGARLSGGGVDTPPAEARFVLTSGDGRTAVSVEADAGEAARFSGKGSVDAPVGLRPFSLIPRETTPVSFEGTAAADVGEMVNALGLLDHVASGRMEGAFKATGTWGAPALDVDGALTGGRYENLKTGTVLTDLSGRVSSKGDRITLHDVKARAGAGEITVGGHAKVSFAAGTTLNLSVAMQNATLAHTDRVDAVGGGNLVLSGPLTQPRLAGKMSFSGVEVSLPERPTRGRVEVVAFRERGTPEATEEAPKNGGRTGGLPVELDVEMDFPGRCFVRGPVVDSEWRGNLRASGTVARPVLNGSMTAVRGHAGLLATRFTLENSTISWNGELGNPYLGVRGASTAGDTAVSLAVTGPVNDTRLELSSTPPMPQDEILSQLLFRRNLSRISPVQAVQLGRVARMFSGKMSAMDLMTGFMRLPGVDMFDIRTGEQADEAVVGAGKYINERIYIEVEQGTAADSGKVSAEVGVTPNISVKGDVGARERGGLGVFWKHDY